MTNRQAAKDAKNFNFLFFAVLGALVVCFGFGGCAKPPCPPGAPAQGSAPTSERKPAAAAQDSVVAATTSAGDDGRTMLREGWRLVSSAKVKDRGEAIATTGYRDADWYPTRVPTTVLAALVEAGVHPEPYKSDNLRRIPAAEFARSFWFRREFDLPESPRSERVLLGFDGINYRANIWLNGKLVASAKDVRGTFRTYRF